jgi:hypothetical protein
LFQINISANYVSGINCPSAFTAAYTSTNHNVSIKPGQMGLYNQCMAAALDPAQNIAEADSLYIQHPNLSDWKADLNKCGISIANFSDISNLALAICTNFSNLN